MKYLCKIMLSAALATTVCANAETVSQKQAMSIAETFFNALYGQVTAPPKMVWNGRQLTTDRLFAPFYVYNSPKGGFVIISAENKAFPVIAYSSQFGFNKDKLGDAEKKLLERYAHEIEIIRYDSRIPSDAMHAWQNLAQHIDDMVNRPYSNDRYRSLGPDEKDAIEEIDRRNGWIVMPTAVEFPLYDPDRYRDITLDDVTAESTNVEIPFSFYEDFIETARKEAAARDMQFEEILNPTKPVVKPLGAAHYQIAFPEEIHLSAVYSMNGRRSQEKYYKNTNIANINIESLPEGFYACMVLTNSGKVYGFKLAR